MEKDVVWGMQVDPAKAAGTSEHTRQPSFGSRHCKQRRNRGRRGNVVHNRLKSAPA